MEEINPTDKLRFVGFPIDDDKLDAIDPETISNISTILIKDDLKQVLVFKYPIVPGFISYLKTRDDLTTDERTLTWEEKKKLTYATSLPCGTLNPNSTVYLLNTDTLEDLKALEGDLRFGTFKCFPTRNRAFGYLLTGMIPEDAERYQELAEYYIKTMEDGDEESQFRATTENDEEIDPVIPFFKKKFSTFKVFAETRLEVLIIPIIIPTDRFVWYPKADALGDPDPPSYWIPIGSPIWQKLVMNQKLDFNTRGLTLRELSKSVCIEDPLNRDCGDVRDDKRFTSWYQRWEGSKQGEYMPIDTGKYYQEEVDETLRIGQYQTEISQLSSNLYT